MEKRELLAEEGVSPANLNGGGHISNVFEGDYDGDKMGKRSIAGSNTGKDVGDWEDLATKAQSVGRQWKRAWERDGLKG